MSITGTSALRDAALYKLVQEKISLEESRQHFLNEIKRINGCLQRNQAEYGKIFNENAPVLQLPIEVTCMIFNLSVSSRSFNDRKPRPEIVISQVCKHWRDVSLAYPQLWSRFSFLIYSNKSLPNALERFQVYLERSGSRNLELYLDFRGNAFTQAGRVPIYRRTLRNQHRLLDMAVKHVKRWKIVTLLFEFDSDLQFPGRLSTASAPNLEYFAFLPTPVDVDLVCVVPQMIEGLNPTFFQGGAPKLRYLLSNCSNQRTLPPFTNLTTLRLEVQESHVFTRFQSWEAFFAVLSMPLLANLSITGNIFFFEANNHVPIVSMNNLKHLRYAGECMTFMLCFLRAPLLETLCIYNDSGIIPRLEAELGDILADLVSFPSLHTLTLIDFSPRPSDSDTRWRILRQLAKNIKSLTIAHSGVKTPFFRGLSNSSSFFKASWPDLNCITVKYRFPRAQQSEFAHVHNLVLSRPKDMLRLRLSKNVQDFWRLDSPDEYKAVQENCTVEAFDAEAEKAANLWPPGVEYPDYALRGNPFQV